MKTTVSKKTAKSKKGSDPHLKVEVLQNIILITLSLLTGWIAALWALDTAKNVAYLVVFIAVYVFIVQTKDLAKNTFTLIKK